MGIWRSRLDQSRHTGLEIKTACLPTDRQVDGESGEARSLTWEEELKRLGVLRSPARFRCQK